MPVTFPVVATTVATAVLLLLHVPLAVASDNIVVVPTHTLLAPDIGAGVALTVRVMDFAQPVVSV